MRWGGFRALVWVFAFGLVAFAAGATGAQPASVQQVRGNFDPPPVGAYNATVYGKALLPVGYVDFCGRGESECQFRGGKVESLAITTENWDDLVQINRYVNTKIRPVSDMELYHKPDYWTYPTTAGDCEDYVLLKKKYLVDLGFNPDQLLITVVLDENREGHAVLTVVTNKGDYVLDNRRMEILRWDQTGYLYLKRQSQPAANEWVSLQKSAPQIIVATKAN
jgi:predicted transglutaminase-like cysteine proteinase